MQRPGDTTLPGLVTCPSCRKDYDRATAIDEMFADGHPEGYARWTGGSLAAGIGRCAPGRSVLLDVRGRLERAYYIAVARSGSYLAGGMSATFLPQGFVMVAVAPDPEPNPGTVSGVELLVQAVGAPPDASVLPPYKEVLLEARLVALSAPKLTPVLCVAALDIYFESLSGGTVRQNRPKVWSDMLQQAQGLSLAAALGTDAWLDLKRLLAVRDAIAHGRDYVVRLPTTLQEAERRFIETRHLYEEPLAPSARYSLSVVLKTITAVARAGAPASTGE
jgi:hypothetical protein